jgi:hypothetical protein
VPNVRGRALADTLEFVRETCGEDALDRLFASLEPAARGVLAGRLREAEWYPLDLLPSLLRSARDLFAPDDEDFYRRAGFYGAQREKATYLGVMVSSPEVIDQTAATVWRLFYDVGRLDMTAGLGRIYGFPTTPELCRRFAGVWEGIGSTPDLRLTATETCCVLRGGEYCEFRLALPDGRPFP